MSTTFPETAYPCQWCGSKTCIAAQCLRGERPSLPEATHFADDATLARIAELERENAELKKDAERYRMLRANIVALLPEDARRKLIDAGCSMEYDAEALDAFLDAAIASEKENERGEHTKEPWPEYLDVAVVMTPNPDGPDAAVLSFEDYKRARACVNACAGIPTESLELGIFADNNLAEAVKGRVRIAELESALAKSASREAVLVEKVKVAEGALENTLECAIALQEFESDPLVLGNIRRDVVKAEEALAKIKEAS